METLKIKTARREELLDITAIVEDSIINYGDDICAVNIFVPHTTAGITVNENADPDVKSDILDHMRKMVPQSSYFKHCEGNSDAHIKASLMGFSLTLPVLKGKIQLGTWQGIMFAEFDGPRERKIYLTPLKSS